MNLIERIDSFIRKQGYHERLPSGNIKITTHYGRRKKPLKPFLKVGGKLLPREVAERKKLGRGG